MNNVIESKIAIISKYYDYKYKSYNEKYNLGHYTHIHTGVYDSQHFPLLYRDKVDFQRLGIKLIKYLLFAGQENLTNYNCKNFLNTNSQKVLDCGCGHGGTSIYLAHNYNIKVVGITVSRQQELQSKRFVRMAGLQHLVDIRRMDIFECNFDDAEFNGIIGIDSFCQIGNLERLIPILSKIMQRGGKLLISDNFIEKTTCNFKKKFDSYWRSDISTLQQLLTVMYREGFFIKEVKELTKNIIPFWKLSITYSKLRLGEKEIENNERERQRLRRSISFHKDLLHAFCDGGLYYYSLILEKA